MKGSQLWGDIFHQKLSEIRLTYGGGDGRIIAKSANYHSVATMISFAVVIAGVFSAAAGVTFWHEDYSTQHQPHYVKSTPAPDTVRPVTEEPTHEEDFPTYVPRVNSHPAYVKKEYHDVEEPTYRKNLPYETKAPVDMWYPTEEPKTFNVKVPAHRPYFVFKNGSCEVKVSLDKLIPIAFPEEDPYKPEGEKHQLLRYPVFKQTPRPFEVKNVQVTNAGDPSEKNLHTSEEQEHIPNQVENFLPYRIVKVIPHNVENLLSRIRFPHNSKQHQQIEEPIPHHTFTKLENDNRNHEVSLEGERQILHPLFSRTPHPSALPYNKSPITLVPYQAPSSLSDHTSDSKRVLLSTTPSPDYSRWAPGSYAESKQSVSRYYKGQQSKYEKSLQHPFTVRGGGKSSQDEYTQEVNTRQTKSVTEPSLNKRMSEPTYNTDVKLKTEPKQSK